MLDVEIAGDFNSHELNFVYTTVEKETSHGSQRQIKWVYIYYKRLDSFVIL